VNKTVSDGNKKINSIEVNSKKKTARKVDFTMGVPKAQNVFLVGDFNSWDISSHLLKRSLKEFGRPALN
jgi:1,4-alpha-glucan branching enzyme